MRELLRLRHENAASAEELQRALLLAEHSSRTKSRFLATVSHEMRTPLNGIMGVAQLMQQAHTTPIQRAHLDVIAHSARHLQSVIGDLLDLSRIESGRLAIVLKPARLHDLVREVVDLLLPVATEKGLRVEVRDATDLPEWIVTDAARVKQVLHNLLGNAIKFTAMGEVALNVELQSTRLLFSVSDTGIGIAADQTERIFQAFEQMAKPGSAEYRTGTGLGLTISRELAHALGGDLTCSSTLGRGSTFSLNIPCQPCAPADEPVQAAAADVMSTLQGRVLVAEDSPVNAMIAKAMLEHMGLAVDCAEDGVVALERMQQQKYELVLMDCQMPLLDGWQTTRRWRHLERESGRTRTPIVAMTANAVVGDRERCLDAGMDDYLSKPVEMQELKQLLRRHVPASPNPH